MTAIRRWQIALVIVGVALLALGGIVLLTDIKPTRYLGIAGWFVGALIIHDGIVAMVIFGVSVIMRKFGRRIPGVVIAIVQGALVIAAIVAAIVVPEILKQGIGTANPSILPLDYARNLGLFYAGLAVVTGLAIAGYLAIFARRQKLRPSISHD